MKKTTFFLPVLLIAGSFLFSLAAEDSVKTTLFYHFNQFDEEWHLWQPDVAEMYVTGKREPLTLTFKQPGRIGISERDRNQRFADNAIGLDIEYELSRGEAELVVMPANCEAAAGNPVFQKLQPGRNRVSIEFPRPLSEEAIFQSVDLRSTTPGTVIVLRRAELRRRCQTLETIDVDVETGSPVRQVSPSQIKEKLRLKLTNSGPEEVRAELRGTLTSFFGRRIEFSAPVRIASGETLLLPMVESLPEKGVYLVDYELRAKGENPIQGKTRFAVFDPVGITPGSGRGFLFGSHAQAQLTAVGEHDTEFYAAALIGIKILRVDTAWCVIEPQPGKFDFSHSDYWINGLEKYHIEPECLMGLAPQWAEDPDWKLADPTRGKPGNLLPRDEPWANFLGKFAANYGERVRFYELYNESDLCEFGNFSAQDYIRSFNAGADAIHAANSAAKVMSGYATIRTTVDPKKNFYPSAVTETLAHSDLLGLHEHGGVDGFSEKIDTQWLPLMKQAGKILPFYFTETATDLSYGEDTQAASIFQKLLFAWSRGAVAYNWYKVRNNEYRPAAMSDFGLLNRDFSPKAVYAAYNELIQLYREGEYVRELPCDGMRLLLFSSREGKQLLAGWHHESGAIKTVLLNTDAKKAVQIDLMGNRHEVPIHNGVVLFAPGKYPATLELTEGRELSLLSGDLVGGSLNGIVTPGSANGGFLEIANPTSERLTFLCRFVAAPGISAKSIAPVTLAPREKKQIPFELQVADNLELPQTTFGSADTFRVCYEIPEAGWRGEIVMPVNSIAKKAPLDGFSNTPQFVLDQKSQHTAVGGFNPAEDDLQWKGPGDLSGKVYLTIAGDELLVRVDVTDDKHVVYDPGDLMWQGDSLQLCFVIPHQPGKWGVGASLYNGESRQWCWEVPAGENLEQAKNAFSTAVERKGDQTTYLLRFPLKMLHLTREQAARGMKFNVQINDNDTNARDGWIVIDGFYWNENSYPSVFFQQ